MSNLELELIEKINRRDAVVGIVGLGYVGLPLVVAFAEAGFKVVGVDVDAKKVANVNPVSYTHLTLPTIYSV